jgi:hypothetical protein
MATHESRRSPEPDSHDGWNRVPYGWPSIGFGWIDPFEP